MYRHLDMMIQSNSTLCLKNFYGVFNSLLRHVSTTGSVSNVNNLFNFNHLINTISHVNAKIVNKILLHFNSQWRILQIPSRNRRSEEVKKFYSETGDYNPPNQDAIDRFKRLRWGAYIHARAGRAKHLYRRSESELDRRSEHILTNRATTFLINNLLNRQWRTPKYYPNDIYEPYHQRTGVPWDYRLRKPKFFP
ncbi:unnamed protein product [Schistosoma mattheei]|uniref:39S ribosomal protein L35, mitochondrial n=1 Tax=Schistosoma mattheei TaxID=31246 RepID=A0A183PBY2_9TREM|nr:unnamed protein product [Schistosoma mattheei]